MSYSRAKKIPSFSYWNHHNSHNFSSNSTSRDSFERRIEWAFRICHWNWYLSKWWCRNHQFSNRDIFRFPDCNNCIEPFWGVYWLVYEFYRKGGDEWNTVDVDPSLPNQAMWWTLPGVQESRHRGLLQRWVSCVILSHFQTDNLTLIWHNTTQGSDCFHITEQRASGNQFCFDCWHKTSPVLKGEG